MNLATSVEARKPVLDATALRLDPGTGRLRAVVGVAGGRLALCFRDAFGRERAALVLDEDGPPLGFRDLEGRELRGQFGCSSARRARRRHAAAALASMK